MLEYERAYTVEQALRVSPYSLGSVGGVCTLTDYYMEPVPVGGLGPAEAAPVCRVRLTADAAGERMEITLKLPTPDPHARLEYTYPVPAGSFRAGPDVARVSKTRYRLHTLRRQVGAPDSRIPDGVVCTLDVFSHPPGLPPVLELEGDPAAVDALVAELVGVPWLVARDKAALRTADLARPLR